jgi:hypothetical protein
VILAAFARKEAKSNPKNYARQAQGPLAAFVDCLADSQPECRSLPKATAIFTCGENEESKEECYV